MIWGTIGSPEWKWDGIRVDNPSGNYEGFPFETYEGKTIGLIDNTILSVDDS